MTREEARARYQAEQCLVFAHTFIEPVLEDAAGGADPTATAYLPNHIATIGCYRQTQAIVKSRKIAQSLGYAHKALCICATQPKATVIILSYDEDEAKEKNTFLEWAYKAMVDREPSLGRELGMSEGQEIRKFKNGARCKFMARKAPTGAGAYIICDEFSVERPGGATAQDVLIAALGATTHTGSVSIGGTQRGADTIFNQIVTGQFAKQFEGDEMFKNVVERLWEIHEFPWWSSPALCNDVPNAMLIAPQLETVDRVARFGNDKLKMQYVQYVATLGLEIFQREFECKTLDDSESYFDYALIKSCWPLPDASYPFDWCEIDGTRYGNGRYGDPLADAKQKINHLARLISSGLLDGDFGFAMDIGRENDQDEFMIGHCPRADRDTLALRLSIGMNKMPFPGKRELLSYIMKTLPITRGLIDGTTGGMGTEFAEWAKGLWGQRAETFIFTNTTKQIISSGLKARMQSGKFVMPNVPKFRKLENQLLKVKKFVSPSGNVMFDVERNKQFHGDCYWSTAMLNDLFGHPLEWAPRRTHIIGQRMVMPLGYGTRAPIIRR